MKPWCHQGESVWRFDKGEGKSENRNIDSFGGENYFYSVMAGSMFVTDETLTNIFKPINDYKVILGGTILDTPKKLNDNYWQRHSWELSYPEGANVSKKDRNTLFSQISQYKDNGIEYGWWQLENSWGNIRDKLFEVANKQYSLDVNLVDAVIEYKTMFEWRNSVGSQLFSKILKDSTFYDVLSKIDITNSERLHTKDNTAFDEIVHGVLCKYYSEFQDKCGVIDNDVKIGKDMLACVLDLAPQDGTFITSDTPVFIMNNENGLCGQLFVVAPKLAIFLVKQSENLYCIGRFDTETLEYYNRQIFSNAREWVISFERLPDSYSS
jgi:hypothetical protein